MTDINLEQLKKLREETGVGIMASKRALEEAQGDFDEAKKILEKEAAIRAQKRSDRETSEGVVTSYIHADKKSGAIVELCAETDFVSRNDDFEELAYEIAMQVCAMAPADKEELLEQEWIRDPQKKIGDLIQEMAAKTKENIELGDFCRIEIA